MLLLHPKLSNQTANVHPAQAVPAQSAPAQSVSATGTSTSSAAGVSDVVVKAAVQEEKKIPVMSKSSLGVSIRHPQKEAAAQSTTAVQTPAHAQVQPEEDYIFNEKDLNYYWQEYAGRLPVEHKHLLCVCRIYV